MDVILKKIKYLLQTVVLITLIENWWEIALAFIYSDKLHLLRLKNGGSFIIKHYIDALVIKEDFFDKEYDVKLQKPKVIVDIGAHIGTTSVFFSKKYPQSKIYAFEPGGSTFKLMEINLLLNDAKNVFAQEYAVAGRTGTSSFFISQASGLSSIIDSRKNTKRTKVQTLSLSETFKKYKIKRCDLLKVDTEGSEFEMLINAPKKIFRTIQNIVMEYHNGLTKYDHSDLVKLLKAQGYKINLKWHSIEEDRGIIYAKK